MAISFLIFVINFYGLVAVSMEKDLQRRDFYLVNLQTALDCFFMGLLGTFTKTMDVFGHTENACDVVSVFMSSRSYPFAFWFHYEFIFIHETGPPS